MHLQVVQLVSIIILFNCRICNGFVKQKTLYEVYAENEIRLTNILKEVELRNKVITKIPFSSLKFN